MAILKVRDENNNFIDILQVAGAPGPDGPDGQPGEKGIDGSDGLEINEYQPEDNLVLWLAPSEEEEKINSLDDAANVSNEEITSTEDTYSCLYINTLINSIIERVPELSMITFTIGNEEYLATEGMTWGEWLDSSYNTTGFYISTFTSFDYIYTSDGTQIISDLYYHSATAPTPLRERLVLEKTDWSLTAAPVSP